MCLCNSNQRMCVCSLSPPRASGHIWVQTNWFFGFMMDTVHVTVGPKGANHFTCNIRGHCHIHVHAHKHTPDGWKQLWPVLATQLMSNCSFSDFKLWNTGMCGCFSTCAYVIGNIWHSLTMSWQHLIKVLMFHLWLTFPTDIPAKSNWFSQHTAISQKNLTCVTCAEL